MKHIDEHTLELLALGDPLVKKEEAQIQVHLAECSSCRSVYDEMMGYYEDVRREYSKSVSSRGHAGRAVVPSRAHLRRYFESPGSGDIALQEVRVPTVFRRIRNYAREHPLSSSSFAVILLALFAFTWKYFAGKRENPSYYFYNSSNNDLEIYSTGDRLLWSLPVFDARVVREGEGSYNFRQTVVADLDGDGRNEVVTTVTPRNGKSPNPIRVYDATGALVESFSFPETIVRFDRQKYDAPFQPGALLTERMPGGAVNLFSYATNGRSPSFLARLDGRMNVIGRYWHYGNFYPYLINRSFNGVHEIAIVGTDDMNDIKTGKFNFLCLLDPSRMVGDKESPETPGFGFAPSTAELYYIKLSKSDLEIADGRGGIQRILKESDDSLLHVEIVSSVDNSMPGFWGFDYVFNLGDMSVSEVKFDSPTPETYASMKKQGKVHGNFDRKYLGELKDGVEYWNGEKWVKEPTEVKHK